MVTKIKYSPILNSTVMTRAKNKQTNHQNNPQTANQTKPSEIIFIKSANSTTLSKRYVVRNTDYYVAVVKS